MSLWRLEWLRIVRTRRLMALAGTYLFFGVTGPFVARYLPNIIGHVGGRVRVSVPPPVPADGVAQYVSNASQIGLLVVVLVAGAALAFDARREMGIFLRTRVRPVRRLVLPALLVNAAVAAAVFAMGTVAAWYETDVLIGALPAGRMLLGLALGMLFLGFAVALTALAASVARSVLASAGIALAVLLGMAIVGTIGGVGAWLPTHLMGALAGLARGDAATGYLRAAGICLAAAAACIAASVPLATRREL
ncbi:MAG TPA: hypothetical protein VFW71_03290 [Actinomycetota bacterium]|nr:hypothetical protein [Actinomycetota bacterium]